MPTLDVGGTSRSDVVMVVELVVVVVADNLDMFLPMFPAIFKNTSPSRPLARNLGRSVLNAMALWAYSRPLSGRSPSIPDAPAWFNLFCELAGLGIRHLQRGALIVWGFSRGVL